MERYRDDKEEIETLRVPEPAGEDDVPRGWRPSQDTIEAISQRRVLPSLSETANASAQQAETDIAQGTKGQTPDVIHVPDDVELQFDELESNATYEKNGYIYDTDEQGRPAFVAGTLKLEPGERSPQQTDVGHQGLETDEGGHLFATRFDGPTDGFNLVPQDANLNRGEWKAMENEWAEALENGHKVEVAVQPVYLDDSRRPVGFDVLYSIDGQQYTKTFYNESSKDVKS
jgi:hypothetical protein